MWKGKRGENRKRGKDCNKQRKAGRNYENYQGTERGESKDLERSSRILRQPEIFSKIPDFQKFVICFIEVRLRFRKVGVHDFFFSYFLSIYYPAFVSSLSPEIFSPILKVCSSNKINSSNIYFLRSRHHFKKINHFFINFL